MKPALLSLFLLVPLTGCSPKASASYPLEVCVISGEKLGKHGESYVFSKDGQEVRLCCESCLEDFNKDPDKYLKQIAAAAPAKK